MDLTIVLEPKAARALHRGGGAAAAAVVAAAAELGLRLEPMHPGVDDPQLARYFTARVPDAAAAQRAIDRLLRCNCVDGVYLKPEDAAP